jgi:hypothetical protein
MEYMDVIRESEVLVNLSRESEELSAQSGRRGTLVYKEARGEQAFFPLGRLFVTETGAKLHDFLSNGV